jgi:hypothetical protein
MTSVPAKCHVRDEAPILGPRIWQSAGSSELLHISWGGENEYGAMVEWHIDVGKPKNSEKTLSQHHFVHNKSHMDWPGCEHRTLLWQASD